MLKQGLTVLLATWWLAVMMPAVAGEAKSMSNDPVLEARVMVIAEELRCLVCQNETIAASHADLAVDLRSQIRIKLTQGQSSQQILDFMVARYGDFVLYRPPLKASTVLLWVGPFALLLLAAGVLAPGNAQLLADHADVLAVLQGQSAAGEPTRLIERALAIDPVNLKALALAGTAAFERKDTAAAVAYWTRAKALATPNSDFAAGLDRSLEAARAELAAAGIHTVITVASDVDQGRSIYQPRQLVLALRSVVEAHRSQLALKIGYNI